MTDEQIVEVVKRALQKHTSPYNDIDVSVLRRDGNDFTVRLERMYEYVPVDFETLNLFSTAFNTKLIDVSDKRSSDGCETCDYGSSYVIDMKVRKANLTPPVGVACDDAACEYCGSPRQR